MIDDPKSVKSISERLREFNAWRRGVDETQQMPNPADIGELIDTAADRLEVLERAAQDLVSVKQALKALSDLVAQK